MYYFIDISLNEELISSSSIENIDRERWGDFVYNHPHGNIFQTPEFYQIYENTCLYKPIVIIIKRYSEIVGLLLINVQKEFPNYWGYFTSRAIVWGGPLLKENDPIILNLILNNFNKIINRKTIYCQFRNMFDIQNREEIFSNNGYKSEPHLNIIVDLTKNENELWNDICGKAKNRIRAAKKKGTVFIVDNKLEALLKCYEILKEVYWRIKLPMAKLDYFVNLFNTLRDNPIRLFIFTAQYNNYIIGCLLAIGYKETIYGLYNGARAEFYDKCPNDLLPWEIFRWGKNNGYQKFDWLGAGRPEIPYGVRDYKMKFGGKQVNFGRFVKINKPLFYNLGRYSLNIYQSKK